ncbi:pilus assembly protein PilC [Diaphorobacter sp. HDW4A]|nr:PilC/PilY family type IV pilus protein [Diaphorobacter sp. HDW4A]QIL83629.1 pilus assembly protein PilC [Diaphorobacter sp. HDW4A]
MKKQAHFKKTLLASMIGIALAQQPVLALDFAQSPPGTIEPYIAPNLIISVDDSGSMNYRLDQESATGATNNTTPNGTNNTWLNTSRRMNVLKHALNAVFSDTTLLPDGKIRLSWQAMWNNGKSPGVGASKKSGNTTSNAGANSVDSASNGVNSMRVLDDAHRTNFKSFISSLSPVNGTPSHWMFSQADAYLRRSLSTNGPWASTPGKSDNNTYLGCRRNYHIMMTDGRWNSDASGGNKDGVSSLTLPDGVVFKDTAQTKLYRDTQSDTLADWAFYSWSTNLQPSLYDPNAEGKQVPLSKEYRQAAATRNFGNDSKGKAAVLDKYWNPEFDPANWPHLVTYTIGFSAMSYTWPGANTISAPSTMVPFGYDGSFPDFVTGNKTWPAMSAENVRALDLWHAAVNGRGRFYAVQKGEDLEAAFRDIVKAMNKETEPDRGSIATSGSTVTRNGVNVYVANYDPRKAWSGWIEGKTIKPDGTTINATGWGTKTTADWLNATSFSVSNRLILSWGDSQKRGVPFKWATNESNLSTAQKAFFNVKSDNSTDSLGQDRLNYVRGDQTKEGTESPLDYTTKPFRQRQSRQGDMINSSIWYVGAPVSNYSLNGYTQFVRDQKARQPMIYVGANDGMLHGFKATDGEEKIAYVPRGVIPNLAKLTYTTYNDNHKYFVDGSPMSGDVNLNPESSKDADWRTMLVGTLGAGGKGYFVLDVTKPETQFSETNASTLVVQDRTLSATETFATDCSTLTVATQQTACKENKDIGHVFSTPVIDDVNILRSTQFVRMNNDRWAVVMGNGYNSTNQRPVLLIQFLDGNKELVRIPATADTVATGSTVNTTDNGLSSPRVTDINGDGRPDVIYAGDLKGNMWKFIVASADTSEWKVAFDGKPLYTATGPSARGSDRNQVQPITAAPTLRANDRKKTITVNNKEEVVPVAGMMVAFGTGMNITTTDPENTKVQTLYSVLDNTRYKAVGKHVEVCTASGDADCKITSDETPKSVTFDKLLKRGLDDTAITGSDRNFWVEDKTTNGELNWAVYKGWYMDLTETSERLLKQMSYYDASNILAVFTQVPAKGTNDKAAETIESCTYTSVDKERQYLTLVNIMDGKKPSIPVFDVDGDGAYTGDDGGGIKTKINPGAQTLIDKKDTIIPTNDTLEMAPMPVNSLRPTWRQLR